MTRTDDTGGVYILRPEFGSVEKGDMDENRAQRTKERGGGVSNGRATADLGKQMAERTVQGTQ
jgi:hypothetical protein